MQRGDRVGPEGRFQLEELLAEGGMGSVFRARDTLLEQLVAVKFLRVGGQREVRPWERLKREAEILASLRHPGVTAVYAYDLYGDTPYLVEELLIGNDLDKSIRQNQPLAPAIAQHVLISLAEILAYVHSHGLLHRDIKPANVFLEEDDRVRLMDFGLARPLDRTRLTQSGGIVGSVGYMPPEVLRGEEHTKASDIYQVGLTLYRALTLNHLHGEMSDIDEYLRRVLSPDWRPSVVDTSVPADLRTAIEGCCHFNVEERFADGQALLSFLQASNATHTGHLRQPLPRRQRRRHVDMEASAPTMEVEAPLQESVLAQRDDKKKSISTLYIVLAIIAMVLLHHRLIWPQAKTKAKPGPVQANSDGYDKYRRMIKEGRQQTLLDELLPIVRSVKELEKTKSPSALLALIAEAAHNRDKLEHRFAVSLAWTIFGDHADAVYRPMLEKHFIKYSRRERLMATIRVYLDGLLTSRKLTREGKEFKRHLTRLRQRARRFGFLSDKEERESLENALLALDYANWCLVREFGAVGWHHIAGFVLHESVPIAFFDEDRCSQILAVAQQKGDYQHISTAVKKLLLTAWFEPKDQRQQRARFALSALHSASLSLTYGDETWMKVANQLTDRDNKTMSLINGHLVTLGHDKGEWWLAQFTVPERLAYIGAGGLEAMGEYERAWRLYRPLVKAAMNHPYSLRGVLYRGHRLALRAEMVSQFIDDLALLVKKSTEAERRALLRCAIAGAIVARRYGDLSIDEFEQVPDSDLATYIGKQKVYQQLGLRIQNPPVVLGTIGRLFAPWGATALAGDDIQARLFKHGDELCIHAHALADGLWMVLQGARRLDDTSTVGLWFDTLISINRWDRPRQLRPTELRLLRSQAYLLAARARETHEEKRANLTSRVKSATDEVLALAQSNLPKTRLHRAQIDLIRVLRSLKKPLTPLPHSLLGPSLLEGQRFLHSLPQDQVQKRFDTAMAILHAVRAGSQDERVLRAARAALTTLHQLEDNQKVSLASRIRALPIRVAALRAIGDKDWAQKALVLMQRFQHWQVPMYRRWQQPYLLAQAYFDNSFQLHEKKIYALLKRAEKEPLANMATIRAAADTMVELTDGQFRKGLARAKRR